MKTACFAALLLLLVSLGGSLRADPVLGPAVEQNGLRFESWLASPMIEIPIKGTDYRHGTAAMLFSVRVTNTLPNPVHFDPFALGIRVFKLDRKEIIPDPIHIAGRLRVPSEADYLLLQPGQSLVLPEVSNLYWYNGHFCLSWSSKAFPEHPWVYSGLSAGDYEVHLHYKMPDKTVQLRTDFMGKVIKTLDGFWTSDVMLPPVKLELEPG